MAKKHQLSDAFKGAKGQLHRQLGVPKGTKIPAGKLHSAASGADGPLARKRAQAALNMEAARSGAPGLVKRK